MIRYRNSEPRRRAAPGAGLLLGQLLALLLIAVGVPVSATAQATSVQASAQVSPVAYSPVTDSVPVWLEQLFGPAVGPAASGDFRAEGSSRRVLLVGLRSISAAVEPAGAAPARRRVLVTIGFLSN